MHLKPLKMNPLRQDIECRREGDYGFYDATHEDLEFSIEQFPLDVRPGLYRLTIMTPDAISSGMSAELRVERDGKRERVRIAVRPKAGRLDLFFVPHGGERDVVLTLTVEKNHLVSLGPANIKRVSTSLWRTTSILGWVGSFIARPQTVFSYTRAIMEGFRKGGPMGARRHAVDAYNASIWSKQRSFEQGMDQVMRQLSITNGALLRQMNLDRMQNSASLSIIIPVFRTPSLWLAQLVKSLNEQTELTFEAIFVLDGPQPDLAAELALLLGDAFAHCVVTLPQNQGVAAATNAGIQKAKGDFVLVVDHDDVLQRHLVEAFQRASAAEAADIYFADEAITDEKMQYLRYFASRGQFDIRYYLSHPYIVHPIFIRRSLAHKAGLFNESLRISHDVDFFLRCVANSNTIVHIPMVLYFWRTHSKSLGHSATDAVFENTSAAVRNFLSAKTDWNTIDVRPGINFNELDVCPPLPAAAKVAIVIPTKNGYEILKQCLNSIYERSHANETPATIIVIDHQSDDIKTQKLLIEEKINGRIQVVEHIGAWNYSEINNSGVLKKVSGHEYTHVVLMNNDIEIVTDDWLDRMVSQFSWGDVGVVGCCLLYPNGQVQHGGVVVGLVGAADHAYRFEEFLQYSDGPRSPGYLSSLVATRDYSAVTGALMMISLPLFEAVNGLDENLAIGFNDTDLCLRIGKLGFRTTYVGSVVALHYESTTRKSSDGIDHPLDTALFMSRYAEIIKKGDPYYGAQLDWTQTRVHFSKVPQKEFELRAVIVSTEM
jgi:GT2 family glycosyltransferase